jgi:hypothetical protein
VFNIVRSFLALFAGRPRKDESPSQAARQAAVTAAHAALVATDAALSAASMAVITIDRTAIAAEAVTTVADKAVAVTRSKAKAVAAKSTPAPVDVTPAVVDAVPTAVAAAPAAVVAPPATVPAPAPASTPAAVKTRPQGRKVMTSGFDMQAEIAKLAERIIEPVAAKLTEQQRAQITGQIRDVFEQFNLNRTAPGHSFETTAAGILEPVQPSLTDADRRRGVDRLSGAMAAFCQGLQRAA